MAEGAQYGVIVWMVGELDVRRVDLDRGESGCVGLVGDRLAVGGQILQIELDGFAGIFERFGHGSPLAEAAG
jgi:hypothetical protein